MNLNLSQIYAVEYQLLTESTAEGIYHYPFLNKPLIEIRRMCDYIVYDNVLYDNVGTYFTDEKYVIELTKSNESNIRFQTEIPIGLTLEIRDVYSYRELHRIHFESDQDLFSWINSSHVTHDKNTYEIKSRECDEDRGCFVLYVDNYQS